MVAQTGVVSTDIGLKGFLLVYSNCVSIMSATAEHLANCMMITVRKLFLFVEKLTVTATTLENDSEAPL